MDCYGMKNNEYSDRFNPHRLTKDFWTGETYNVEPFRGLPKGVGFKDPYGLTPVAYWTASDTALFRKDNGKNEWALKILKEVYKKHPDYNPKNKRFIVRYPDGSTSIHKTAKSAGNELGISQRTVWLWQENMNPDKVRIDTFHVEEV